MGGIWLIISNYEVSMTKNTIRASIIWTVDNYTLYNNLIIILDG